MQLEFYVQNVKCDGCVSLIQENLSQHAKVQAVHVDRPSGKVTVTAAADIRATLSQTLRELGYPERAT